MSSPVADLLADASAAFRSVAVSWYRAVTLDLDGVRLPVAAVEDIIVMKVLAARPKDLDDIAAMAAAQGPSLDEEAVRKTLAELEAALDQRDLMPVFDLALSRARRAPSEP